MAGVASDHRQIQFSNRILRPINRLRYTRQPSCIDLTRPKASGFKGSGWLLAPVQGTGTKIGENIAMSEK
jgi:hypothetical protein